MKEPIAVLLRSVPLFEELSPFELDAIAPLFVERKCRKGVVLFFEGDAGDDFFIIKSGLVKIHRIDRSKEIILALFRDGDFFGEMALLQKESRRSATAETLEPTVVYALSRAAFTGFLGTSPQLALSLLASMSERLSKANGKIEDLTFLDVRSRICKTLVRLADEYGIPGKDGIVVQIKLTHQQIANMAGTVRESVTKMLLELQDEAVLTVKNKWIIILEPEKLRAKGHS